MCVKNVRRAPIFRATSIAWSSEKCVGCGRSRPKAELLRIVLSDGRLVADPEARLPGRGAYVCKNPNCLTTAVLRHGFERSFRAPVRVPNDHLDWVR